MGRRTFDSLDRSFPNRLNIVITSNVLNGITSYPSLDFALQALSNKKEVFVIGGGRLFAEALKLAAEMRLTLVDRDVDGDTFFPPYEDYLRKNFQLVHQEYNTGFSFVDYVRIK
jgi:dihydrofolate reductase